MSFVTITNVNAVTNVNIRSYWARDQAAVVDLWERCGLVVPHNDPLCDIESKQQVNPEWFLVGELEGQVVATCMVGYEGHRGWINYLAVSPDYRRGGIATQMVLRAEEILSDVGCPKINLQVRESNRSVKAFYEHLGYANDRVVSLGKRLGGEAC
jgi:ribosomal protein S18 acetylase RimI-like enzyme